MQFSQFPRALRVYANINSRFQLIRHPLSKVRALSIVLVTLTLISISTASFAETIVFRASDDFPDINAGEVPYYVHQSAVPVSADNPYRNALAINAGIEEYRDKFARATTQYTGSSGFFDITIIGLAELDGEAQYRLLINDVLVGTASNPEVDTDYTPVRHTFEDIVVPEGATLAVESLANTNGQIPEGDGTAFARGRWTALELFREDETQDNSTQTDLSITASISPASAAVGEQVMLSIDVTNNSEQTVATAPVLSLTRPRSEVSVVSMGQCTTVGNDLNCPLSELAAGDSSSIILTLEMLQPTPAARLRVSVESDQTELTPDDNTADVTFAITADNGETGSTDAGSMDSENSDNTSMSSSGGGTVSWQSMLALALIATHMAGRRRRHPF